MVRPLGVVHGDWLGSWFHCTREVGLSTCFGEPSEVFEVCRAEGWQCTDKVLEVALMPFRQVGGTEVVEDGFRVLRVEETLRSGYRKEVSRKRAWHALIQSGTETEVHRYEGVAWRSECAPRGLSLRCPVGRCPGLLRVCSRFEWSASTF